MKRSALVVLVSLVIVLPLVFVPNAAAWVSTGDGSWFWQNPLPQGNALYGLSFSDELHGWAVGEFGTIVATSDGGTTWTGQISKTTVTLRGVSFPDAAHGWVVGSGGYVSRTVDGGATWTTPDSGVTQNLYDVCFADATHGWAVGANGCIIATSDGGATWGTQTSGTNQHLYGVTFIDASHGWAVGSNGRIIVTGDGGATWSWQTSGVTVSLDDVEFASPSVGWAVGNAGTIVTTTNGGASWTPQVAAATDDLNVVTFADAQHGWAFGSGGAVLATADGGTTWNPQTSGIAQFLGGAVAFDATHAVAVGGLGRTISTADGGQTWTCAPLATSHDLHKVCFVDVTHGWAVGSAGAIVATTNGGLTWRGQTSGTTRALSDVCFVDRLHGWAVGDDATILATSDGGTTWNAQTSSGGNLDDLSSVTFADALQGCTVSFRAIFTTKNGGATWVEHAPPLVHSSMGDARATMTDVAFVDATRGWGVAHWQFDYDELERCFDGFFATTDGGVTWTKKRSSDFGDFHGRIALVDATHVWVLSNGLWRTTDGGQTWQQSFIDPLALTDNFERDFTFSDRLHGWAVGNLGGIAATSDGGKTWVRQRSGMGTLEWWWSNTADLLSGVAFSDSTHGWAVGGTGAIVATTNGGTPADITPPTTKAVGAVNGGWYNHDVTVDLVATDNPGGWGVRFTEYSLEGPDWIRGTHIVLTVPPDDGSGQYWRTVDYRSMDKAFNEEEFHGFAAYFDTAPPTTKAPYAASVARYGTAKLYYKVVDPEIEPGVVDPALNDGPATVTIRIKNAAGAVVKTLGPYRGKRCNRLLSASFTCKLRRGTTASRSTRRTVPAIGRSCRSAATGCGCTEREEGGGRGPPPPGPPPPLSGKRACQIASPAPATPCEPRAISTFSQARRRYAITRFG